MLLTPALSSFGEEREDAGATFGIRGLMRERAGVSTLTLLSAELKV